MTPPGHCTSEKCSLKGVREIQQCRRCGSCWGSRPGNLSGLDKLRAFGWEPPLPRMPYWSAVVHRWCCSPTVVWLICCASGINIALISLHSSSRNAHFWPTRSSKFRAVWMPMALSWSRVSGTTTYATVSRRFGPVVWMMWWWRCCMPTATPPTSCSVPTN